MAFRYLQMRTLETYFSRRLWEYVTDDPLDDLLHPDYFASASDQLEVGDMVLAIREVDGVIRDATELMVAQIARRPNKSPQFTILPLRPLKAPPHRERLRVV